METIETRAKRYMLVMFLRLHCSPEVVSNILGVSSINDRAVAEEQNRKKNAFIHFPKKCLEWILWVIKKEIDDTAQSNGAWYALKSFFLNFQYFFIMRVLHSHHSYFKNKYLIREESTFFNRRSLFHCFKWPKTKSFASCRLSFQWFIVCTRPAIVCTM